MPKVVDHEARKRRIVDLALELFAKRGYHAASFGDIADACGLSRTNVYNYFKNKDEIFYYAINELLGQLSADTDHTLSQHELSVSQKLQHIYYLFTNDIEQGKNSSIILDLALRTKRGDARLTEKLHSSIEALRLKIESLLAGDGSSMPTTNAPFATTLFFSLIESSLLRSLFTDSAFIQENIGSFLKMLQ